ncbi:MAG: T9SS type A sorting domain-containing protein [Bacteroidetes bacterium]|nr:T9SS type A sorting domain-containing protein [Bacteroidota bacterium]
MKKTQVLFLFLFCALLSNAQNSLHFDGTNDYVQCTQPGPTGTASRTVEAWVKISSLSTNQRVIVDWGDMAIGQRFTLNIINGLPRIEVGGSGFSATNAISTNVWHHIAATFDNNVTNKLKLFVDGQQAAAGDPSVATLTSSVNGIIIGRRNDANNYFSGQIDEVRVWNIAKSQTQIAADMNLRMCPPTTGLVAYFKFDQGTASGTNAGLTSLTNAANAANNGTLTNFSLSGASSNWVLGNATIVFNPTATQAGTSISASIPSANYQWINCANNSTVAGATSQTFTPINTGSYAVIVSKNGCSDTSNCVTMSVSVNELAQSNKVSMYPNPTSSYLQLEFTDISFSQQSTIDIINLQGKLVYSTLNNNQPKLSIDMKAFPAGFYIIEVKNAQQSYRKQLIKN